MVMENNLIAKDSLNLRVNASTTGSGERQTAMTKSDVTEIGILTIKSANRWVEDAAKSPDPRTFFHGLIYEYTNTVLFASTKVGKSILAVQIAEDIAKEEMVLYLDLELSAKQFESRYTDSESGEQHQFPRNLLRAEINPGKVSSNPEKSIMDSIVRAALQGIKFFIIDNMTYICCNNQKAWLAGQFMIKLRELQKENGLTIVVIAHTPKRNGHSPITINDLSGSANLGNLFDTGIALAHCASDTKLRYLKEVMNRSREKQYDSDNVMLLDKVETGGYLHFEIVGYGDERELLSDVKASNREDKIIALRLKGYSIRDIAKQLGLAPSTVQYQLDKLKKNNTTLLDIASREEANDSVQKYPSCTDCTDYTNSTDCTTCTDNTECTDCTIHSGGTSSHDCTNCTLHTGSTDCTTCTDSTLHTECTNRTDCTDCTQVENTEILETEQYDSTSDPFLSDPFATDYPEDFPF